MSNLDDNVCPIVDLYDTSSFLYKTKTLTPLLVFVDFDINHVSPLHTKMVHRGSPCQHPSLHISSSSIGLNIIKALKLTKFRRGSKSNLTRVYFDNVDVHNAKSLPPYFQDDILLVLLPVPMGVLNVYGRSMNGKDKMCNGHPWCT